MKNSLVAGLMMIFALCDVNAEPPSNTRARLINPNGFVNSGTIHLQPRSPASDPPPTTITVDTTLNPMNSGSIAPVGSLYTIGTNYGVTAGTNEFFSFSTFNLGSGDTADFVVPSSSFTNIISRVTGGASSTIAGTIETTINGTSTAPSAGFWFVNPAGVIVTAGAQINVPAGLAIGAADYIQFTNGDQFYSDPSQPLTLSASNPASFGFLATNPANGALTLNGATISLLNGGLTLSSGPAGLSLNDINIETNAVTDAAVSHDITLSTLGAVAISNGSTIQANETGGRNAGAITISGASIAVTDSTLTSNSTYGGSTGNISLIATGPDPVGASALQVTGGSQISESYNTASYGTSSFGQVSLMANQGTVRLGFATDSTPTEINVSAPLGAAVLAPIIISGSSVTIDGAIVLAEAGACCIPSGTGISITSTTGPVILEDGAQLNTSTVAAANALNIQITGPSVLVNGASVINASSGPPNGFTSVTGNAGDVTLTATGADPVGGFALEVSGGASISSNATQGATVSANAGNITLSASEGTVQIGRLSDLSQTTISTAAGSNAGAAGAITINGAAIGVANAILDTSSAGIAASLASASPGVITLTANGPLTIADSSLNASTSGAQAGGAIVATASTISVIDSQISASTIGSSNAGSIILTATGADPGAGAVALQVSGGSSVSSNANSGESGAGAGSVTLSAPLGTVQVGATGDSIPTTISTGAGGSAGSVGQISITGLNATLIGADVDSSTGSSTSPSFSGPAITVGAGSGEVQISGGTLSSQTFAGATAADIDVNGPQVLINNGAQIRASTTGAGNAGNITLSATGANQGGVSALQVTGSSTLSSDASQGQSGANAGSVTLTATSGSVQIGLPTDSGPTNISTSTGANAGQVGSITIAGAGIALSNANVTTTAAGTESMLQSASPGAITLTANNSSGAVTIVDSTVDASTSGVQLGGQINITGAQIAVNNSQVTAATTGSGNAGLVSLAASGPDVTGTAALQVAGGAVISSDAWFDESFANAGTVSLTASRGTVQIGLPTDSASTLLLSRAGALAGSVGSISVTGASVALDQAQLLALSASSVSPSASQPAVSVTATGPISFVASVLNSNTSGTANSGNISVSGESFSMSGSSPLTGLAFIDAATLGVGNAGNITVKATGADPPGGAALQLTGGSSIASQSELEAGNAGPGGNAGSITLIANDGTVEIASIGTRSSLNTLAGVNSGGAGAISISANQIEFDYANIYTTVSTTNTPTNLTPASVTLSATGGISLLNSIIDLQTTGTVNAGSVSINGGTVTINGGLPLAPVPNSPFSLAENAAIFTGSSGTGNGGSVSISSAGPLTISNATISSQSVGSTGYGGQIALAGSGVLISQQSLISADYRNPGGNPGAAGTITISSTGTEAPGDPLQAQLTSATPGVVRIVDSGVTASNDGGNGSNGSIGSFGQVLIGLASPGQINSGNVVIVGSVISTDVLDSGLGNNLTIAANNGVYIGQSTTGGFADPIARPSFPDPRPSIEDSLISAQTDATAVSGGQIAISAGAGGITVVNSDIDAGTTRTVSGIVINDSGAGAVTLTGAALQSGTSGLNRSGDITVGGPTISVAGGTITATTTGLGDAGNIVLTASGADPQGGAALLVSGGATITSDAINGQNGANAGNVTLSAPAGSVQIGQSTDSQSTLISTAAGVGAGRAGSVTIMGSGIKLDNASLDTTAAGTAAALSGAAPGTIALSAGNGSGPLTITNSGLDATTSGAQQAGEIDLSGSQIAISNTNIASATTSGSNAGSIDITGTTIGLTGGQIAVSTSGSGNAGNIVLTASGADPQGGAALLVSGGATITSDAINGQNGANAGNVTLSAPAGSVQIGQSTDSQSTLISTAAGVGAGRAGSVTIMGSGIKLDNASLDTTAAGTAAALSGAAPGTIALSAGNGSGPLTITNSGLDATTSGAQQAGEIDLSGSQIAISNTNIASATTSGSNAGSIDITGTTIGLTGGQIAVSTLGSGNAGNVSVIASGADPAGGSAIEIQGSSIESAASGSASNAAGGAGTITIKAAAGSVLLGNAAAGSAATDIETSANAFAAQAGIVSVSSAGALTLQNTDVTATVAGGSANSTPANIVLSASGPITVAGGSVNADSSGAAPGGAIQLLTAGAVAVSGAAAISSNTSGAGKGGDIDFGSAAAPVASLAVSGASTVSVDASGSGASAGSGGAVNIYSAGPVSLSGAGTAITSNSSMNAVGGSVMIGAMSLTMDDGAVITADTTSDVLSSGAAGSAARAASRGLTKPAGGAAPITTGGGVTVTASGPVALSGKGTAISANATGSGSGGTVTITAASLTMSDGAELATTALGSGNSGTITINLAPTAGVGVAIAPALLSNSEITTNAAASTGGNITINAGGTPLTLNHTAIVASAEGTGDAGNITINAAGQMILQASGILGEAVSGNGGAITIKLDKGALFIEDTQSLVSAQSQTGNNGTVTIDAPQVNLNAALTVPDVHATRAPELASNACRRDASRSTFVREGRGGVAQAPDAYLSSSAAAPLPAAAQNLGDASQEPLLPVFAALAGEKGCQ